MRRLTAATASLLLLRAEFASVELAQARAQLLRWFLLALAALLLALLGLFSGTALFVVALWPHMGAAVLIVPAVLYFLTAALLLRRLQREVADAPPLLAETLQEIARDRDALRAAAGRGAASGAASAEAS